MATEVFDVIVVGSGAAGGMAALRLTAAGARVLLLEAGPDRTLSGADHPEARLLAAPANADRRDVWGAIATVSERAREFARFARGEPQLEQDVHLRSAPTGWQVRDQLVQSRCRGFEDGTSQLYVSDAAHPYTTPSSMPFGWIRGRQLGGRTQTWKRITPRLGDWELKAAERDGFGEAWPLSAHDLAPHYAFAERVLRVVGSVEAGGPAHDGVLPQRAMTKAEVEFARAVERRWPERRVTLAPFASPLGPNEPEDGLDDRLGRYDNGQHPAHDCSVRSCLWRAQQTGRLTIETHAAVHRVTLDQETKTVDGVAYLDTRSKRSLEARGRIVMLCASTLESTRILLNSENQEGGMELANSSGVLGHYLFDHLFGVGAVGIKMQPHQTQGFPHIYVPPFRNRSKDSEPSPFIRSYQMVAEVGAVRAGPLQRWMTTLSVSAQGEVLPLFKNRVSLNRSTLDEHGLPTLQIDCRHTANEVRMAEDMLQSAKDMLQAADYDLLLESGQPMDPGFSVHELGTARMGQNAATSVLNSFCQSWDVPNLYVADGAAFPSGGCQNPTLTIMALAARAADHALGALERGEV